MKTDTIHTTGSQPPRKIVITVSCSRISRKCDITIVAGAGGYLDLEDASPREIVERIEELLADTSLKIAPIDPADLHALVRQLAKKRGIVASPFELAAEDDAEFFRRNPRAVHRTRPLRSGELGPLSHLAPNVIVTQIAPDLRIRRFGVGGEQVH